ncbi:MAG: DUF1045 domain-containing protein [Shimia sp.]
MSRYAIYCVPDGDLGDLGAAWLGWDVRAGRAVPSTVPEAWVATPRRYGFHATLKPPMRLAETGTVDDLAEAVAALAARTAPARAERLEVAALGGFVALRPVGEHDLGRVAAACVEGLDGFRAPAPPEEVARRRAAGLTDAQEALLTRWGYPYVLDEFHFHVTLSGRVPDPAPVARAARAHLGTLPAPFTLDALALCEETPEGFRQIHRYPLTG